MPTTADNDDCATQVLRLNGGYETWRTVAPRCREVDDILHGRELVLATLTDDTMRACPRCGTHFSVLAHETWRSIPRRGGRRRDGARRAGPFANSIETLSAVPSRSNAMADEMLPFRVLALNVILQAARDPRAKDIPAPVRASLRRVGLVRLLGGSRRHQRKHGAGAARRPGGGRGNRHLKDFLRVECRLRSE
jgi:hypothetical protein